MNPPAPHTTAHRPSASGFVFFTLRSYNSRMDNARTDLMNLRSYYTYR